MCVISTEQYNEWVSKQDVGTESFTEKEKGQASDSFKRACFNWGIGRELYTAPFIWIKLTSNEVTEKNGKPQVNVKFYVKSIDYSDSGDIKALVIVDNKGVERFSYGVKKQATQPQPQQSVDYIKLTREYLINKIINSKRTFCYNPCHNRTNKNLWTCNKYIKNSHYRTFCTFFDKLCKHSKW